MKVLLIGGSGTLGKELVKKDNNILCPTHDELDISIHDDIYSYVFQHKPDIIINAAAIIDNRLAEKVPQSAINTNIIGAANVAMVCIALNIRLVYISTDYIYKGDRGNYKETDEILPFNFYSWTKLGGECATKGVKNHLIIRTSFGKNTFDYPEAFVDKWVSKDYVDVIAPMILKAAISPLIGVLNVGTERKTIYDHAKSRNSNVKESKLINTAFSTPYDNSFNLQKWFDYENETPMAKPHKNCRVCGSDQLIKYLDLGVMPLANNLEFNSVRAKEKERFPLQVLFCNDCSLSQLSTVIDPERMFSYYTYRSSINAGYVKHCAVMAEELQAKHHLNEDSFMVDIAGNDGTLLKEFKELIGLKVLNVDPATNLVAIAESQGIESMADFWSVEISEKIKQKYGQADLITATNVFAHVDNVLDFVNAAKNLLKENGILVLEFPYLMDFIQNFEFDTVYFEHLSYFGILPMDFLCQKTDMKMISVKKQNIHGGTVRVILAKKESSYVPSENVRKFIINEYALGFDRIDRYNSWADSVKEIIADFGTKILELKKTGKKIAAFAASAKGNTLLCSTGINTDLIKYIADETPEKIGKYSPGTGIPIVNKQQIEKDPPDYLIILSWNFKDEIMQKLNKIYKGKYIIPIPNFEIIQASEAKPDKAEVFSRKECVFRYCPNPESCTDKCDKA